MSSAWGNRTSACGLIAEIQTDTTVLTSLRGVQAGMPGGRCDDIELAVAVAATRQGLSKGDAIETYRRLVAEGRAQFVGRHNTRVKMRRSGSFPGTEDVR